MKMEVGGGTVATAPAAAPVSYVSSPPPPMPPVSAAAAAQINAAAAFQAAAAAGGGGTSAAAAAMAAAQNAASMTQFQEALMSRMHAAAAAGRTLGLAGDMKDLQSSPFSGLNLAAAAAAAGSGSQGFAGLPFLSHMAAATAAQQPSPFGLHHFVDPRLPFPPGAFRPFFSGGQTNTTSSAEATIGKFGSAFQPPPPTKLGKGSPPSLFSPGQNLFPRSASAGSGHSPSSSPPSSLPLLHHHQAKTDENSNTSSTLLGGGGRLEAASVSPISMDSGLHEDVERNNAKRLRLSSGATPGRPSPSDVPFCCPICQMPLRPAETEAHFAQELDYLTKLSTAIGANHGMRGPKLPPLPGHPEAVPTGPYQQGPVPGKAMSPRNPMEVAPRSRWDTFTRIQRNRQSRIRVKLSRRAGKRADEVLEEEANEEKLKMQHHHQQLLQQQHLQRMKPKPINACNQTDEEDIDIVGDDKERANTSLSSSSGGAGGANSSDAAVTASVIYGPPQFTEADVLACVASAAPEAERAERAGRSEEDAAAAAEAEDSEKENVVKKELMEDGHAAAVEEPEDMQALKAKVRKLEENNKCSKCTKSLSSPVVNVACWHIQCERCWLLSVGTKKSCSLCGMATAPSDLRRVYL